MGTINSRSDMICSLAGYVDEAFEMMSWIFWWLKAYQLTQALTQEKQVAATRFFFLS